MHYHTHAVSTSAMPTDNDGFSCFELLGYDIMLDEELRPWLIECNHSSSFNIDSPLDLRIKEELVTDTLKLVGVCGKGSVEDPGIWTSVATMQDLHACDVLILTAICTRY